MSHRTESDLSCPICHEIFTDPVILQCSHSFCKDCLQTWWRERPEQKCPVCLSVSSLNDPPRNLALRNLCENFLLEKQQRACEPLCSLHSKKLRLFCLDHQELICLVCRDSKTHNNHQIRPVDEAAEDHREELRKSLKPLQEKLKLFKEIQVKFDQTADHIKVQARNTERQISKEFQRLHRFLHEEEEARLTALREEEEQKSQTIKKKMEALSREISTLSEIITSSEEKLRAEDISFLNTYKAAVERVKQRPLLEEPKLPSEALIDVAKHLGNLSFNIWKQMKEKVSYSPVILDPNTAHVDLMVSEDLTAVRGGGTHKLPDNPERFHRHNIVLGSEGFCSGTHCWDVDVRNNNSWRIGVKMEDSRLTPYRELCFSDGKYTAVWKDNKEYVERTPRQESLSTLRERLVVALHLGPRVVDITVKKKLQKVRVHLDCENNKLSFFDPESNSHLHTSYGGRGPMFPYIHTSDEEPVKISPVTVSPSVEQLSLPPSGSQSSS